jgi:hypothetical protein
MSDITLFNGNNVPDHIRNRQIDDVTASLAGGGGVKRISIRGKVFRLMDGGQQIAVNEDRAMNVVSPASNAQNPQAASCADCPQNIKGSGQGDSRACRFSQRLAIVLENDIGGDVYQLTLPSQSIFGKPEGDRMPMQAYAKYLKAQRTAITAVVTEAKFDINSSTPRLTFKAIRWLNEEELDNAIKQSKSPASVQAITMTVAQVDKVEEASAPAPKAEVKAAKVDVATSEPTKRESKKPAVEAKQELSDVLAQWADD